MKHLGKKPPRYVDERSVDEVAKITTPCPHSYYNAEHYRQSLLEVPRLVDAIQKAFEQGHPKRGFNLLDRLWKDALVSAGVEE